MRKIEEVFVNGICLKDILDKHKKWVDEEEDGERANLSFADLSLVDLSFVNLFDASLKDTNLSHANLRNTDLSHADLTGSDLTRANLKNADLRNADLSCANLIGANLSNAKLSNAILNDIAYNVLTTFLNLQCPEKGSFIGYKKADKKIVELLITEDAKRSSATTRKCRCNKAKVLSITNIGNTVEYKEAHSDFNYSFVYRVGEVVEVKDFDEDRWKECSTGIHFFLTRGEAVNY